MSRKTLWSVTSRVSIAKKAKCWKWRLRTRHAPAGCNWILLLSSFYLHGGVTLYILNSYYIYFVYHIILSIPGTDCHAREQTLNLHFVWYVHEPGSATHKTTVAKRTMLRGLMRPPSRSKLYLSPAKSGGSIAWYDTYMYILCMYFVHIILYDIILHEVLRSINIIALVYEVYHVRSAP